MIETDDTGESQADPPGLPEVGEPDMVVVEAPVQPISSELPPPDAPEVPVDPAADTTNQQTNPHIPQPWTPPAHNPHLPNQDAP
jgi:hypothetical protein